MRFRYIFNILLILLSTSVSANWKWSASTLSSGSGESRHSLSPQVLSHSRPSTVHIAVHPDQPQQTLKGLGASLTESSAFVLAHLTPNKRSEVLTEAFGPKGFSMVRTHIGSCDFTVDGSYSYRDHPDTRFSLDPDRAGFHNPDRWPGVHDRDYDLLPLIQEVFEIQPDIQLIASPWTAPPWMKSPEIWFRNGFTDEQGNQHYGTGGRLLPEHHKTFSDYLVNYVQHMKEAGIPVWAVTPVNEPIGNGGKWESMHMEPIEQAEFIAQHLGPDMKELGVHILGYDHNRGRDLIRWADVLYQHPAREYLAGLGVHWYSSTWNAQTESLDRVHGDYPDKWLIHTEGCIDDLGRDAPYPVADPEGYREPADSWWKQHDFWWGPHATDWGYTALFEWNDHAAHPRYAPTHRYARNIIESLNHHVSGWVDWNLVLDRKGGPNHVGNFCGAPILIDTKAPNPDEAIYFTPVYDILMQAAAVIREGSRVLATTVSPEPSARAEGIFATGILQENGQCDILLLNTLDREFPAEVMLQDPPVFVRIPANSFLTLHFTPTQKVHP